MSASQLAIANSVARLLDEVDLDSLIVDIEPEGRLADLDLDAFDRSTSGETEDDLLSARVRRWWDARDAFDRSCILASILVLWSSVYAVMRQEDPTAELFATVRDVVIAVVAARLSIQGRHD